MNKSQSELLLLHVTLFLSGDFDGLNREIMNVAFASAAIDVMTEDQLNKATKIARKRRHAMFMEVAEAAKEYIQNTERGGTN